MANYWEYFKKHMGHRLELQPTKNPCIIVLYCKDCHQYVEHFKQTDGPEEDVEITEYEKY